MGLFSFSCLFFLNFGASVRRVVIGSGFGGEGFKFGIFIGEMLANMALGNAPSVEGCQERFRPSRLPLYDS